MPPGRPRRYRHRRVLVGPAALRQLLKHAAEAVAAQFGLCGTPRRGIAPVGLHLVSAPQALVLIPGIIVHRGRRRGRLGFRHPPHPRCRLTPDLPQFRGHGCQDDDQDNAGTDYSRERPLRLSEQRGLAGEPGQAEDQPLHAFTPTPPHIAASAFPHGGSGGQLESPSPPAAKNDRTSSRL